MSDARTRAEELQAVTAHLSDDEFIRHIGVFLSGRVVFATSLGAEDQVLTDLLTAAGTGVPVVTLDTGRLPQETYDLIERTREHFRMEIRVLFPDAQSVEQLVASGGPNLFYRSIDDRKSCCQVRKVEPLRRVLRSYDAWVTGMRRSQSVTRDALNRVDYDAANDMIKINPLIEWSSEQIWARIRARGIPYNRLHDQGYPSIGCAPCTRAVKPGEDERAGRWWWERPEQKECGIHIQDGKAVRERR